MLERRGAVLVGFHEAERRLAIRQPELVWIAGIWRLARVRRSGGWYRIRVCDESDGNDTHRRPARCGAERRTLHRTSSVVRRLAGCGVIIGNGFQRGCPSLAV